MQEMNSFSYLNENTPPIQEIELQSASSGDSDELDESEEIREVTITHQGNSLDISIILIGDHRFVLNEENIAVSIQIPDDALFNQVKEQANVDTIYLEENLLFLGCDTVLPLLQTLNCQKSELEKFEKQLKELKKLQSNHSRFYQQREELRERLSKLGRAEIEDTLINLAGSRHRITLCYSDDNQGSILKKLSTALANTKEIEVTPTRNDEIIHLTFPSCPDPLSLLPLLGTPELPLKITKQKRGAHHQSHSMFSPSRATKQPRLTKAPPHNPSILHENSEMNICVVQDPEIESNVHFIFYDQLLPQQIKKSLKPSLKYSIDKNIWSVNKKDCYSLVSAFPEMVVSSEEYPDTFLPSYIALRDWAYTTSYPNTVTPLVRNFKQ